MAAAALVAVALLAVLAVFQLALIFGAPLGRLAWGGGQKVLPRKLRIGSIAAILTYTVFAVFALSKAGIAVLISNATVLGIGLWAITAYLTFGTFLNAVSKSRPERYLMTPVAAVLAICFLMIALA